MSDPGDDGMWRKRVCASVLVHIGGPILQSTKTHHYCQYCHGGLYCNKYNEKGLFTTHMPILAAILEVKT